MVEWLLQRGDSRRGPRHRGRETAAPRAARRLSLLRRRSHPGSLMAHLGIKMSPKMLKIFTTS